MAQNSARLAHAEPERSRVALQTRATILRMQLEDARVAVEGYQTDCQGFQKHAWRLEGTAANLQEECEAHELNIGIASKEEDALVARLQAICHRFAAWQRWESELATTSSGWGPELAIDWLRRRVNEAAAEDEYHAKQHEALRQQCAQMAMQNRLASESIARAQAAQIVVDKDSEMHANQPRSCGSRAIRASSTITTASEVGDIEARRTAVCERICQLEELQSQSRRLHVALSAVNEFGVDTVNSDRSRDLGSELLLAEASSERDPCPPGWSLPPEVLTESLRPLLHNLERSMPPEHTATATRLRSQLITSLETAGETGHEQLHLS